MRLILDMNLSPAWVPFLQAAGHEVEHWRDIGRPDAPDAEILIYAVRSGAIVLTHDLDFGTLLAASGEEGPSVLQMREPDVTPQGLGRETILALAATEEELVRGALVTVDLRRARVTLLPLRRRAT